MTPKPDHEKLDQLMARVDAMQQDPNMAVIANDITYIKRDVAEIKEKMDKDYVTMDKFVPVRNIVYGLVGILGTATVAALLKLILRI